jgi:glycosyltransferase involved in cell wall biosynthesis
MTPRVSILVPSHERPALLAEALASARAQDVPADQYEVVVVHDGLVAPWLPSPTAGPPPLRVHAQPKRGLGAAVNTAVSIAAGDCFTLLADDDLLLPSKLRVLLGALDAHPEWPAVYSLAEYVGADGQSDAQVPIQCAAYLRAYPVVDAAVIARHGFAGNFCTALIRRAAWLEAGPWDETLPSAEEWDWLLRFVTTGHSLHAVEVVTTRYRRHPGQKSGQRPRGNQARRNTLALIDARYGAALAAAGEGAR